VAYFVNPGISNTVSGKFHLTNKTVVLFVVTMCVCLYLSVLINGMSKILKVTLIFVGPFCHNFEITQIPLDGISRNFKIEKNFENLSRKFNVH
jgi:hypothetical protein